MYSNANKFICENDSASDPDNFDYQTELAKKLKTIEDGNSLTIDQICDVAYNNAEVALPKDKTFWETIERSRQFLMD